MIVKEIPHGQYCMPKEAAYNKIVARKVGNEVVYFSSFANIYKGVGSSFFHGEISWGDIEVEPISFQTALLLLIQECTKNPPEECNNQEEIKLEHLPIGEFFLVFRDYTKIVGRKFCYDKVAFLTDDGIVSSCINNIQFLVTPITMHQAVIRLTQQLIK